MIHSAFKNIFSSLYSRNYRIYFAGQGISLIGTWMQNIALSWLVYRLTGSVFLLGLIGFTSQIPTFVLSPFTGVLTDRYSRLKIMTFAQVGFMLQALIMTLLVLLNLIEVWHIVLLSILFGIFSALDAPARQSLVIELIDDPRDLGNAIALNSAIFNGARLIGPAIAGITIAAVGEGICFLLNTFSFVAVIGALFMIRIPSKPANGQAVRFRESYTEGFRYTFHTEPIRMLIILLAILSLFGVSFVVLLPAYAKEILHGNSDTLGFLMSALGAGAMSAALFMASRKSVLGLTKIISFSIILLGLATAMASLSSIFSISLVMLFMCGVSMVLTLSSINTLLQTIADEDKRGRVMSFYAMALMGTAPIGSLLAGTLASRTGIWEALLICGILTFGAGIWFVINYSSFQKHIRPLYIVKGIIPGLSDDIPG